jgi:hypothetical protein
MHDANCVAKTGYRGGSTSSLWKHTEITHNHAVMPKMQSSSSGNNSSASMVSCTVTGTFGKTSITSARCEQINELIIRMIANDTLPICFVEGVGFRELMALHCTGLRGAMCKVSQRTFAKSVRYHQEKGS